MRKGRPLALDLGGTIDKLYSLVFMHVVHTEYLALHVQDPLEFCQNLLTRLGVSKN